MQHTNAVTWNNVEGLSDHERELGQAIFPDVDLRHVSIVRCRVNGELIPDIISGVVQREGGPKDSTDRLSAAPPAATAPRARPR